MTLKIIDKAYAKKINRIKKQSTKYKQRSKYLMDMVIQHESRIETMTQNTAEIVQNFEETQKKLFVVNNELSKSTNNFEFVLIIMIMFWMFMFVSLVRMVRTGNGFTDDNVDTIYGCLMFTSIFAFIAYCAVSRLILN